MTEKRSKATGGRWSAQSRGIVVQEKRFDVANATVPELLAGYGAHPRRAPQARNRPQH